MDTGHGFRVQVVKQGDNRNSVIGKWQNKKSGYVDSYAIDKKVTFFYVKGTFL